jgi:hypothetical protein
MAIPATPWRPDRRHVRALNEWSQRQTSPIWMVIVWKVDGVVPVGPFDSWDDANAFVLERYLVGKALIREVWSPETFAK